MAIPKPKCRLCNTGHYAAEPHQFPEAAPARKPRKRDASAREPRGKTGSAQKPRAMPWLKQVEAFECQQCGWCWLPRDITKPPQACASCRSRRWKG